MRPLDGICDWTPLRTLYKAFRFSGRRVVPCMEIYLFCSLTSFAGKFPAYSHCHLPIWSGQHFLQSLLALLVWGPWTNRTVFIAAARINPEVWLRYSFLALLWKHTKPATLVLPWICPGSEEAETDVQPSCELSGQHILRKLAARQMWGWAKDICVMCCLPGAKR